MKSKLLALFLILCLALAALPAALADDLLIDSSDEAADAAAPELGDAFVLDTPDSKAPQAPDVEAPEVNFLSAEPAEAAPLANDALIDLTITYTGPTLSKVYDKTRNIVNSKGEWLLDSKPNRASFALSGILDEASNVKIASMSITKFESPDVGLYDLKVSFKLSGDDAARYTPSTATIPAEIKKRPVTVTPTPGLFKLYGEEDPEKLGLKCTVKGLLALTQAEKDAGKALFTGAMVRESGEDAGRYRFLIGTLDFGNDNYEVTLLEEYFTIDPRPIDDDAVSLAAIAPQTCTGQPVTPVVPLKYLDQTLQPGTDFTAEYADNVNPGTATVTITGIGNFTGTRQTSFTIQKLSIRSASVKVAAIKNQGYTGKAVRPALKITYNGKRLVQGTDYRLTYKNNRKVGRATVTITGKGRFTGTRKATFIIVPKAAPTLKAAPGKQQIAASWKKLPGATGYQLAYSLKKNFTPATTKTVKGDANTKLTLKKLKAKTTYFLRVRSYLRSGGKTYYSKWSPAKKVTTK